MIYIVEIPHQLPPKVWSRSTKEQIMNVINEVSASSGDSIYEASTGRDLMDMFGYDSTIEMREDNDALTGLADLIDTHGLDATFHKGYGDDEYTIDPVDEWAAYLAWNGHDLSNQLVFMSADEARDFSWGKIHQGIEARIALTKALEDNGE